MKEVYQRPRSLEMKRPQLNWDQTMADTKHSIHKKDYRQESVSKSSQMSPQVYHLVGRLVTNSTQDLRFN